MRIGERVWTGMDPDGATALRLEAPRPSLAAGTARVANTLPEAGMVRLTVVDMRGREVATLTPGRHEAQVDAGSLAAGVYAVRLTAGSDVATQRLVVVR